MGVLSERLLDWLRSQRKQVCIRRAVEGEEGLPAGGNLLREGLRLPAGRSVSNEDSIRESCHEVVALRCQLRRWASCRRREGREDQETTFLQARTPVARDAHVLDATGGTDHNRLPAPQQQPQTLLLHWGLEPPDHGRSGVAKCSDNIVGLKDHITWAPLRAKHSHQPFVCQPNVSDSTEGTFPSLKRCVHPRLPVHTSNSIAEQPSSPQPIRCLMS